MGSFEVTNQGGVLRKNGGNVASYFGTPDGRVIHAAAGPVPAAQLRAAAQWAVDAWTKSGPGTPQQPAKLTAAHRLAAEDLALLSNKSGTDQRIHELLSAEPPPFLSGFYRVVFEQILQQRVTPPSGELAEAEQAFEAAKRGRLPLLIVLFKQGDRAAWERQWDQVLSRDKPEAKQLAALAPCYVRVVLPLAQLAALSQHLGVRPFAAPDGGSPLFVIARSDGRQLTAVTTWDRQAELVHALAQGAVQEAKEEARTAKQLKRLLKLVAPIDAELAAQIRELIGEATESASAR